MKFITEKVERVAFESLEELMDFLECEDADQVNCECELLKKYGINSLDQYGGVYLDRGRDWLINIEAYDDKHIYIGSDKIPISQIKKGIIEIKWGEDIFFIFYPER